MGSGITGPLALGRHMTWLGTGGRKGLQVANKFAPRFGYKRAPGAFA